MIDGFRMAETRCESVRRNSHRKISLACETPPHGKEVLVE